jgi:hypothetical protein
MTSASLCTAGDPVALFLSLYLGHVLGDFVFQPGRLVVAKRRGVRGVAVHTAVVVACTALVGVANLGRTWPIVLLAGMTHFGVEHLTIGARRSRATSGLTVFLLDQGVHIVSLVLLVLAFNGSVAPVLFTYMVSPELLAAVCGVATVAFTGSILVFELDAARRPAGGPAPILALDTPRLYGMAERGLSLTVALLGPVPPLGVLAFAPRLAFALTRPATQRIRHLSDAIAGLALCALVWVLITGFAATR